MLSRLGVRRLIDAWLERAGIPTNHKQGSGFVAIEVASPVINIPILWFLDLIVYWYLRYMLNKFQNIYSK